jgi:GNAT superfamily N-acetyltransferase
LHLRFLISHAGPDDLDVLVSHRQMMWEDIHPELGVTIRRSEKRTRSWIERKLADGRLIGFIARAPDGKVAGSGCVWIREEQPRPTNPRQAVPYLMSVYTEKPYRRRGAARSVVKKALKWCRDNGYERVVLHASDDGRSLYESLGFERTYEMRLRL